MFEFEKKLSTIEQQHRADEERRRLGGAVRAFPPSRPAPTPEQLTEAARQQKARELPEAMFAGDEQLQRLRAEYETPRAIRANLRGNLKFLESAQQAQTTRVRQAELAVPWLVLADVHHGDGEFSATRQALAALGSDKVLLQAIKDAMPLVSQRPDAAWRIDNAVNEARAAFDTRLMELRLAHVDGQNDQGERT